MDAIEVKRLQRKLDRARECDEVKEAFDICMELGAYFASYEKYEKALEKYKEALSMSKEKGRNTEVAMSQRMIAETYCNLGEYKEAVKHAELYLGYSKKGKVKIEEQRAYATKGRIYFCWAEFLTNEKSKCKKKITHLLQESLTAYERSLKICESELNEVDMKEKQEMKARLFQNLGLVMGSMKNYKEANIHFATAIQINKSQNSKENLYWCYINQGEYYLRAGECVSACTYFDLALKATTSNENINEALKLKAKSYIKMGDLSVAKNILREVYKQKHGKDVEVVKQLKIVVYLCKLEKMIDSTPDNDYESKKKLFERKGDAFCALKQYGQGVEAYLKMLEYAEKCSKSGEDLLPCYSSLAQTYRDDEQYTRALFYCQKELELLKENSVEASRTYLFLAELYELLDYDFETVLSTYNIAQQISHEVGDKSQEIIVLRNMIQMQKDYGYVLLAEENQKLLTELENESGDPTVVHDDDDDDDDGEGDDDDDNNTENFICDISDDELFSDVEEDKPRHQVRRTAYKVKRNQKGESELHVAAIKGDYTRVKSLILKGHPVNEKDLAGWTVLHEACNHGYVRIVELLLNSGADVNNPGGEQCGGITPLHDAAENGHFPVIKLLLRRGACPAILTNDGDTPLDCLKRWRSRTTLTKDESETYQRMCEELKTNLDSLDSRRSHETGDLGRRNSKELQSRRPQADNEDEISPTSSRRASVSATKLYKSAIEGVRRKPTTNFAKKKICPLINEEDLSKSLGEEWLENDLETSRQPAKRRKVLTEERKPSPVKRPEFPEHFSDEDSERITDNDLISDVLNEDSARESCWSPVFFNPPKPSPEKTSPVVENRVNTPSSRDRSQGSGPGLLENHIRNEVDNLQQETGGHHMLDNHIRNEKDNLRQESDLHKFKIQILNDVFLVPVPKSEVKDLTIEWLAKEAEERYNKINGKRPSLLFMTEDDAIVSKDDPVGLLVNEKIKTRVLGWEDVTLAAKYEEQSVRYRRDISLSALDNKPDLSVMNALNMFKKSGNLILANLHLEVREAMIVFEVLGKEKCDVKILDLSRNYLRDEGLEPLMKYLECQSVEKLYLRSNGISAEGIKHFSRRLKDVPEENRNKILAIDFSYNILRDVSADPLNVIIEKLQNLECLGTENCCITKTLKELKNNKRDMLETDIVTSTILI